MATQQVYFTHILGAGDPDLLDSSVGGKARGLEFLRRQGVRVPAFFVLTPGAFQAAFPEFDGNALPDEAHPVPSLQAALEAWIHEHDFREVPAWAVRSSAASEDGSRHSFAGQLESVLDVAPADLAAAVLRVWRSGFSPRLLAYRKEHGFTGPPEPPAVIIQQMVRASKAGVAFSVDPHTGRRGTARVALVDGLGEKLVSGEVSGRQYSIDREGNIPEPGDSGELELVRTVARECRQIARNLGHAQDTEWAWADGCLFWLQTRPITTLNAVPDPDGGLQIWDDSNIAESYSGITTPMTFSFARYIYEEVYRQFCLILAVPRRRLTAQADVFGRMLGLMRGRITYNLLSWYRVLAMLPGFRSNRKFMEQMMGVKETLPDDWVARIEAESSGGTWADRFAFIPMGAALFWHYLTLPLTRRRYYRRMDDALGSMKNEDLRDLSADGLVAHYRRLENQLLSHWDAPLVNDFFAMAAFGLLRSRCEAWLGQSHKLLANDLVSGEGGMVSTEPARLLEALAQAAAESPPLLDALKTGESAAVEAFRDVAPGFFDRYDAYLERFGDRCMEELKLESRTLVDDPAPLLRSVAGMATSITSRPDRKPVDVRARAEKTVAEILGRRPIRHVLFRLILRAARHRVRDRENLRLQRTRLFGHIRRVLIELGKRLVEVQVLDHYRDVFYLNIEELLGFVEGTATVTRLSELVDIRKREFAEFRGQPAPAGRFETRGMVYVAHAFTARSPEVLTTGDLEGLPCCAGRIRGTVRRIEDPTGATVLPGEILVAARTDPGWVLLFPNAAGLLVEHGSLLSHSAIVARELGLPAIVAIPGLMRRLQSGDIVEMDGSTGRIMKIDPASPQEKTHAE